MNGQTQSRFRSDLVVTRAGRFSFDGYVDAGSRPPPQSELFVDLTANQRFPRIGHALGRACWWTPVDMT